MTAPEGGRERYEVFCSKTRASSLTLHQADEALGVCQQSHSTQGPGIVEALTPRRSLTAQVSTPANPSIPAGAGAAAQQTTGTMPPEHQERPLPTDTSTSMLEPPAQPAPPRAIRNPLGPHIGLFKSMVRGMARARTVQDQPMREPVAPMTAYPQAPIAPMVVPFCVRCYQYGHATVHCQSLVLSLPCQWCGFPGHVPALCSERGI